MIAARNTSQSSKTDYYTSLYATTMQVWQFQRNTNATYTGLYI